MFQCPCLCAMFRTCYGLLKIHLRVWYLLTYRWPAWHPNPLQHLLYQVQTLFSKTTGQFMKHLRIPWNHKKWLMFVPIETIASRYECFYSTEIFIKIYRTSLEITAISSLMLVPVIDIGEKHTVTSLLPDCALAVHSSSSACDSMQAAITLTCMARNSLTLFEHIRK